MALAKTLLWQAPFPVQVVAATNAAILTAGDSAIFIPDADCELLAVSEVHTTLGTDGSAVTLDLERLTGTAAVGSGTSLLSSTFSLKATVDTVVTKSIANGGLPAALASRLLAEGDRLGMNLTGTLTAVTGLCLTVWLRRLRRPSY